MMALSLSYAARPRRPESDQESEIHRTLKKKRLADTTSMIS